jgi:hypothetical protein
MLKKIIDTTNNTNKSENSNIQYHNITSKIFNLLVLQFASLAICENRNLQDSQTRKIIIHSEKLVLDPKFLQDSRVKISSDSRKSRYEISVYKTCKSCYEICL